MHQKLEELKGARMSLVLAQNQLRCAVCATTPKEVDAIVEGNFKYVAYDNEKNAHNGEDMLTVDRLKHCAVDALFLKDLEVHQKHCTS
jgi:hypothetical protein